MLALSNRAMLPEHWTALPGGVSYLRLPHIFVPSCSVTKSKPSSLKFSCFIYSLSRMACEIIRIRLKDDENCVKR